MNYFQVMLIKRLLAHKFIYLWLAEIWTLFIGFMCLAEFNNLPSVGIRGGDKYVHFVLYFVFVILWFMYFKSKGAAGGNLFFKIVIVAILYGALIEIFQNLFTTSRNGDVLDVFANTSGAGFAVLTIFFYNVFLKKNV